MILCDEIFKGCSSSIMLGQILEGFPYVYLFILFVGWLFAVLLVRERKP